MMEQAHLECVAESWLGWGSDRDPACDDPNCGWCALPDMYSDETFGKLVLALAEDGKDEASPMVSFQIPTDRKKAKEYLLRYCYDLATKETGDARR